MTAKSIASPTLSSQDMYCTTSAEVISLGLSEHNTHSPSTYLTAAWSLVIRSYHHVDDVLFGMARNISPTIHAIQISFSSGSTLADILAVAQTQVHKTRDDMTAEEASKIQSSQLVLHFSPEPDREHSVVMECKDMSKESVSVQLKFLNSILSSDEANTLVAHYKSAISQAVHSDAQTPVSIVNLCTEADIKQMQMINGPPVAPLATLIHKLVGKKAEQFPDAIAVDGWDASLTYHELVDLSLKLAASLQHRGITPETIVPILFEKSTWVVAAMLAILQAGGAFMAMETGTPEQRLKQMLDKADITFPYILCSPSQVDVCSRLGFQPIPVTQSSLQHLPIPSTPLQETVVPENRAIVQHTSGSTGFQKGFEVTHQSYCTSAVTHGPSLGMDRSSRIYQFSAFSFDSCLGEILTSLICGACVCIPTAAARNDDLAGSITAMRATWIFMTSSVARLVDPSQVKTLKTVVCGGERVDRSVIAKWTRAVDFFEAWGPSETGVFASCVLVKDPDHDPANIGRPLGCRLWVVDSQDIHKLAPYGCIGELCVEGPTVARGYLNLPDKTAAAFQSRPRWLKDGHGTIYRSGDLARFNADGSLQFIGRDDSQIKHHGQRIELPEIEHTLNAHAHVRSCVVLYPKQGPYSQRLVAVFEFKQLQGRQLSSPIDAFENIRSLKRFAKERLPGYMVPNNWLIVQKMPLNQSTKEDRRLLQHELERMETLLVEEPSIPVHTSAGPNNTQSLDLLIQCVKQVLQRDITVHHSFISQGGDSISAMRLVGICRQQGLQISARSILAADSMLELMRDAALKEGFVSKLNFDEVLSLAQAAVPHLFREIGSNIEAVFPCSPTQEGILISQSKDASLYNTAHSFRLSSSSSPRSLFIPKLEAAWAAVVARHQSLRSVFAEVTSSYSSFIQIVQKAVRISIVVHESVDELSRDLEEQQRVTEPPHRFRVAQQTDGSVVCKLEMSHAITDAVSVQIILEELALAYEERLPSESGPLYSDYISYLNLSKGEDALDYWVAYLENVQPCRLRIPSEEALAVTTNQLASLEFEMNMDADLQQKLQQRNLSIASLLQAAWALLLSEYTSQDEVCFAYISASRHVPVDGISATVGAIVATLPCRLTIRQHESAAELLRQVKQDMLNGLTSSHASLATVMHKANLSLSSTLNSAVSIAHDWQLDRPRGTGLLFDNFAVHDPTDFEIALSTVIGRDNRLYFQLDYWKNTFSKPVVQRLRDAFQTIAMALVGHLDSPLSELNTLSCFDKSLIQIWNQRVPGKLDTCIHSIISGQTVLRGGSEAILSSDCAFSYIELEQASDKMAGLIQQRYGAALDSFIPICFEKSAWAIIALLAVLKAGSAFVLLDSSHPMKRLRSMCQQLQAKVVIVSPITASLWEGELEGLETLECSQKVLQHLNPSRLDPVARPYSAAYAVFTSGSTGEPKAIVTEHAAYCSAVVSRAKAIMRDHSSRHLQYASYSFDTCLEDILTTLMVGGTICVPSEEERMNHLAATMTRMRVTSAEITPTVANMITPSDVPSLKVLLLGGEPVTPGNVQRWAEHVHLINSYGPAECSVTSVVAPASATTQRVASTIGRGQGVLTWIVKPSNHNRLAPVGAVGELVLEGPGLARGYLHNEEQTLSAFIANPEWLEYPDLGKRFYKTGDLVQYLSDGQLAYLGRKDNQVKLYGQRIELSEIDTVFAGLVDRGMAVCSILCKSRPLIALFFAVGTDATASEQAAGLILPISPGIQSLISRARDGLTQRLPSYMIPGVFIPISRMPTTMSGKVDRRRLQDILLGLSKYELVNLNLRGSGEKQAPTTAVEQKLRGLWCRVLKGTREGNIGIDDNFFRLGGDSILTMELAAAARAAGLPLKVADIFSNPILKNMAAFLGAAGQTEGYIDLPLKPFELLGQNINREELFQDLTRHSSIEEADVQDVYPCTPFQEGLMAASMKQESTYKACLVYEIDSEIDINRLKKAWLTVVAKEPVLRTRIVHLSRFNGVQILLKNGPIDIETGSDLQSYTMSARSKIMSYGQDLSRCALIDEQGKRYLVWTAHHAIYDGQAVSVILDKVVKAYHGEDLPLTPHFNRFVGYLQHQYKGSGWRTFWQEALRGCQPLEFPARPSLLHCSTANQFRQFRMNLDKMDGTVARGHDLTLATVIRAAWAIIISQYTETPDVVFGETHVGRGAPVEGITQMVGPTLATVPVRVDMSRYATVGELLHAVQNQSLQAMSYEHAGLQNIRTLDESCQLACEFQNLLVIQPRGSNERIGFFKAEPLANLGFHTYPLVLDCALDDGHIDISFTFDDVVMSEAQIGRLAGHLQNVIRQLHEGNLSLSLDHITLFGESDSRQIAQWNCEDPSTWDQESLIHHEFEKQVTLRPEAEAICAWDRSLSYKELDQLSTILAEYLVSKYRLGPEVLVPLVFSKSSWVPVAIFAVLKSGAGFVPIDPAQPSARLLEIIKQSSPLVILHSQDITHLVSSGFPTLEVSQAFFDPVAQIKGAASLEDEEEASEGSATSSEPRHTPSTPSVSSDIPHNIDVSPTNVAYVIFTSGSTGKPKGVVIEHKNFLSGVLGPRQQALVRSEQSRVLQFASLSFDTSLEDIITTLLFGGTVCIPSEHDRMNDIQGFIQRSKANTAHITPSFANTLTPETVPTIKFLRLGGERMTPSHVNTWAGILDLRNVYGPTETSITATCSTRVTSGSNYSDIGKGVAALIWIVNPDNVNQLTPVGLVGEMLVEGALLARGYLHDAVKTADSFISNPAWATGGPTTRRFYRTGDLCRYSDDGTILYIGRRDTQVKIYGQRTELGDVEDNIKKALHKPVDLAVQPLDLPGYQRTLVAFICIGDGFKEGDGLRSPSAETVRALHDTLEGVEERLFQTLPKYMIPSRWIPLQKLPTTVSKKTDRKQLAQILASLSPQHLQIYSLAHADKTQPRTDAERQMQQCWAKVLGVKAEEVGVNDNFLKTGGDSIMAVRLVSIFRERGILISVADIFNSTDLAALAAQAKHATALDPEMNMETGDDDLAAIATFSLVGDQKRVIRFFDYLKRNSIPLKSVQDAYPTTPLQESLISLSAKDVGAYVSSSVFQLPSATDIERFQQAWEKVVSYNEILRTRIISLDTDGMIQVVMRRHSPKWHHDTCLKDYLDKTDMQLDPRADLVRYALIRDKDGGHLYFVLTMHHAVYDGWSYPHILQQVDHVYAQQSIVRPPQFVNFIRHIQSASTSVTRAFWVHKLNGCEESTDLPSFQPQPSSTLATNTTCDLAVTIPFGTPLEYRTTQSIVIRAAWALVIHWYTGGSPDVTFGASIAGRNANVRGIESIVGPTLATIPIRVRFQPDMTLGQLCQSMMDDMIDTIPYEHVGLQNIQAISADVKRVCNFNSLLVIQPLATELAADGLFTQTHSMIQEARKAAFPVVLECTPQGHRLDIRATFDPRAISGTQMGRVLKTLEHALSELSTNEDKPLSQIKPISRSDRHEITTWNGTVPQTVQSTVQVALETSLQAHVDSQVLYTSKHELNYRHLDEYTRRIAAYLNSLGVGPGSPVMLLLEKSIWHTISMASVLRAGGAFVPLDPFGLPEARLRYIASQTEAKVVILSDATAHLVPHLNGVQRVQLSDSMVRQLERPSWMQAPQRALPTSPMYIIFTSGTTGQPKGVVISQQAYMSVLKPKTDMFAIGTSTRVLQFTSHAFDVTVDGILLPLLSGGCVCVPDEQTRLENLDNFILESRANHADLTPSAASTLNESVVSRSLKTLLLGGEKMGRAGVEQWADKVTLFNAWGASELANTVMCNQIGPFQVNSSSNIGRALHAFSWIVDPSDHSILSSIGAVGELCIQGPATADCYLNNKEMTDAVFVAPPVWAQHALPYKLYKTGDLVRYDDDGSIVYLGRKDRQIKVRGLQVEPAEVEQHIHQIPDLGNAHFMVDLAPPGHFDNDKLVLYISESERLDYSQLLRLVSDTLTPVLPQYMIPTWLLPVPEMPLTVNGKLDRSKVLQMATQMDRDNYLEAFGAVEFAEPQTSTELQMQSLWASTLKMEPSRIGRQDNFFHLGGDSIIAMRLTTAVRAAGLWIGVQDIFKEQSLQGVSEAADRHKVDQAEEDAKIKVAPDEDLSTSVKEAIQKYVYQNGSLIHRIAPATDWQAWCIGQGSFGSGGWRNTFTLDLGVNRVDRSRLQIALYALARRHEILRTCFVAYKAKVYQVVMEFLDEDFQLQAVDKMGGPSLPIGILPVELFFDETMGRVHFRVSHAQYDGLSLPIIYHDLNQLYHGKPLEEATPFHGYARATQPSVLPATVSYWSRVLADAPLTSLVNHNKPSIGNLQNSFVTREIPLIRISHRGSTATPATVLKAAWAMTLAKLLRTDDVTFGSLVQTRTIDLPNSDSVIGPCLNILPIRARISPEGSPNELLDQIQDQYINSLSHSLLGFSSIISNCTKWPNWARFSSIVQYQNLPQLSDDSRLSASERKMQVDADLPMVDSCDVWVMALPYPDHLEVRMQFCTRIISEEIAQGVLDHICANIKFITTPNSVPDTVSSEIVSHFPLAVPREDKGSHAPNEQYSLHIRLEMEKLVCNTWQLVLGDDTVRQKPFWEIWSNAVAAAQLARCYALSGMSIPPEEIFSHPTIDEQVNLLCQHA